MIIPGLLCWSVLLRLLLSMSSSCLNSNATLTVECGVRGGGRLTAHLLVSEVLSSDLAHGNIEGLYDRDVLMFHSHVPHHLLSRWCNKSMVALQIPLARLSSILTVRTLRTATRFHHLYLPMHLNAEQLRNVLVSHVCSSSCPDMMAMFTRLLVSQVNPFGLSGHGVNSNAGTSSYSPQQNEVDGIGISEGRFMRDAALGLQLSQVLQPPEDQAVVSTSKFPPRPLTDWEELQFIWEWCDSISSFALSESACGVCRKLKLKAGF